MKHTVCLSVRVRALSQKTNRDIKLGTQVPITLANDIGYILITFILKMFESIP